MSAFAIKEEKIAAPTIAPEAAEGESAGPAADVIDVEAIAEVEPAEVEEAEEFVVEAVLDSKCESRPVLCCERCVVPGPEDQGQLCSTTASGWHRGTPREHVCKNSKPI